VDGAEDEGRIVGDEESFWNLHGGLGSWDCAMPQVAVRFYFNYLVRSFLAFSPKKILSELNFPQRTIGLV
jgi:hypothetical protein